MWCGGDFMVKFSEFCGCVHGVIGRLYDVASIFPVLVVCSDYVYGLLWAGVGGFSY